MQLCLKQAFDKKYLTVVSVYQLYLQDNYGIPKNCYGSMSRYGYLWHYFLAIMSILYKIKPSLFFASDEQCFEEKTKSNVSISNIGRLSLTLH